MLSLQSYPLLLLLKSNDSGAYVYTWFFEATSFNPENPGGSTTVRLHDGRIGMKMVTRSGGVSIVSFSRLYGAGSIILHTSMHSVILAMSSVLITLVLRLQSQTSSCGLPW